MDNLNKHIAIYKEQLNRGDIVIAYNALVKFVMKLRVDLSKKHQKIYAFSTILHGYMDYTYFYYSNDFLKSKQLKFGLVLNHLHMQFELWLLGNTISVQKQYWQLLKATKWSADKPVMPKYAILEVTLVETPDFNNLNVLAEQITTRMTNVSSEILDNIKTL